MIFHSHQLEAPLINYVESIFYYKGFRPDHSLERVVPTGHLFIIFELDGIERKTINNETLQPNGNFRNAWISGMHKDYLTISAHQDSEMLVIQFKTNGAYPFLKVPLHELNNQVIPAEDLFGDDVLLLRKQIIGEQEAAGKFRKVESWLLQQFDRSKCAPNEINLILDQLKSTPMTENHAIFSAYPNSQKHLINQFKLYFGLTPKVFHRIFRFNKILKQIHNKEALKWSDIAYEFGYSDQSHFIKEFKEFSGFNPGEFIELDFHNDETNFFPLDRDG